MFGCKWFLVNFYFGTLWISFILITNYYLFFPHFRINDAELTNRDTSLVHGLRLYNEIQTTYPQHTYSQGCGPYFIQNRGRNRSTYPNCRALRPCSATLTPTWELRTISCQYRRGSRRFYFTIISHCDWFAASLISVRYRSFQSHVCRIFLFGFVRIMHYVCHHFLSG